MIEVRAEAPGDEAAIRALTTAAFAEQSHSSGTEAAITDALRRDGDLSVSLVAVSGAAVVGHVAFSPVTITPGAPEGWFGLGPVSVAPKRQRTGIGSALIRRGLASLEARDAEGCVLIGDPGYYGRFGFRSEVGLSYGEVPEPYVQGLALAASSLPSGVITYAPGFDAVP